MGLYVFNWPISVQVIERIPIAHVIIIIKSEISTVPIVIIFFRGCVPEMFVTSYFVTCCIYIPEKAGFCFHYYCAVYDECKWSDTFWLADRIRLFVHYTIPLSSWCKLIWRHWTIHHTIYGAVCFYFTHFPCNDWDDIYFVLLSSYNRKYELISIV